MSLHRGLLPRGIDVGVGLDLLEPTLRGDGSMYLLYFEAVLVVVFEKYLLTRK